MLESLLMYIMSTEEGMEIVLDLVVDKTMAYVKLALVGRFF